MRVEAVVLGGGAVGTSIAVHLALRGRSVALVDRRGPGEETSHGNAGLIERSSLLPVAFPRHLGKLTDVVLGRNPGANFHWSALPALAPWLFAYYRASAPERLVATARIMQPLLSTTVAEHQDLAARAGAQRFFRDGGWVKLYRSEAGLAGELAELPLARDYGLNARELSVEETLALEPNLSPVFKGAVHWSDPHSVSSPGGVVKAYAAHLEALGGQVLIGDAQTLAQDGAGGWQVTTESGRLSAREAVVALGPWSMDLLGPMGYRMPLAVKRGYHMHYRAQGNAGLRIPVLDEEGGFVLAPMERGIRL
ncbi:MAG: NAD(P)/FAD-dependent oxidoreductase, partial [Hyphomicrobiales bacterium]